MAEFARSFRPAKWPKSSAGQSRLSARTSRNIWRLGVQFRNSSQLSSRELLPPTGASRMYVWRIRVDAPLNLSCLFDSSLFCLFFGYETFTFGLLSRTKLRMFLSAFWRRLVLVFGGRGMICGQTRYFSGGFYLLDFVIKHTPNNKYFKELFPACSQFCLRFLI